MMGMAIFLMQLIIVLLATDATSNEVSDLVAANNEFGLQLYNKFVESKKGNIIFSPLSISLALAMTSLGARGQTLEEIHSTLAGGFPEEQIHEQFQQIMKVIPRNNKNEQVSIANKLYVQKDYEILSSFLESSKNFYLSEIENVDFRKSKQSAFLINKWVSEKTNKKIENIINPRDFNETSRILLVNALYFKAQWATLFETKLTKSQNFYITPKNPVETKFLHNPRTKAFYGVHKTLHFELLEKAFKSREFRFGIILPNLAKTTLQEVEKKLSANALGSLELLPVTANVTFPKFKFQSNFDLLDDLKKLGIRDLFVKDEADLSGIEKSRSLYVSNALHKVIVEVNEKGAVAAAVTAFKFSGLGSSGPGRVIIFRADHPFLFYIKHVDTGSILFLGRFYQP